MSSDVAWWLGQALLRMTPVQTGPAAAQQPVPPDSASGSGLAGGAGGRSGGGPPSGVNGVSMELDFQPGSGSQAAQAPPASQ